MFAEETTKTLYKQFLNRPDKKMKKKSLF